MKKWLIIVLIIVIAIALGITAPMVWEYIVDLFQLATAYIVDLCKALAETLAGSLKEVVATPPAVTNPVTTEVATTIASVA